MDIVFSKLFRFFYAVVLSITLSACFSEDLSKLLYDESVLNFASEDCQGGKQNKLAAHRLITEQTFDSKNGTAFLFAQSDPMYRDNIFIKLVELTPTDSSKNMSFIVCGIDNKNTVTKIGELLSHPDANIYTQFSGTKNKRIYLLQAGEEIASSFLLDIKFRADESAIRSPIAGDPSLPKAKGFVDLHLHQTGAMAFNAGWYWGSHEKGSLADRIPVCDGEHASMHEYEHFLDWPITGPIAYKIAPRRDVDDFMRNHRHMTDPAQYLRAGDRKHQQVAFQHLKLARERGLSLVISTVVENNVLLAINRAAKKGDMSKYPAIMESIRRQIVSLHHIDDSTEWFEIVYDPWHARKAISEGKMAVVIGAEFTDIFPLRDGPWRQQLYDLYDLGLRHLQIVHKSDSQFSSTHNQGFPFDLVNLPRALLTEEIPNAPAWDRFFGQEESPIGVTEAGYALLDEMVRLHMIPDLSHGSAVAQKEMTDYLLNQHNYYPFIYSHWKARDPALLEGLKAAGGMIALGWGQPVPEAREDFIFPEVAPQDCEGHLQNDYERYKNYMDYDINFSLASDYNGFTSATGPNFGPRNCLIDEDKKSTNDQIALFNLMQEVYPEQEEWIQHYWGRGRQDVSLFAGIAYDLNKTLGIDTEKLDYSAEDFILMWERTYDKDRKKI